MGVPNPMEDGEDEEKRATGCWRATSIFVRTIHLTITSGKLVCVRFDFLYMSFAFDKRRTTGKNILSGEQE